MRRINTLTYGLIRGSIAAASLFVAGCAVFSPPPADPVPDEPVIAVEPAPAPEPIEIIPQPEPEPVDVIPEPEPAELPLVAIVMTSNQPAYADVAEALAEEFENHRIYDLNEDIRPPVSILRQINDSASGAVVAIGLRAAKSAVAMSEQPVVFSQVFNYKDEDLLTENSRGVAAVPPLEAQLAAWKRSDPDIVQVGAIVGEGHEDLIAEAELAAARHGIELRVQVTRSDQETLYFFKRMVRNIDGFWLFPDNRILSRRALQEILDDAQNHQVAVLAPSESMLQAGASISISTVAADIAATIATVVRQIQAGKLQRIPPISPLSEIRVKTSDTVQVVER